MAWARGRGWWWRLQPPHLAPPPPPTPDPHYARAARAACAELPLQSQSPQWRVGRGWQPPRLPEAPHQTGNRQAAQLPPLVLWGGEGGHGHGQQLLLLPLAQQLLKQWGSLWPPEERAG